jgi:two-component system NtrC family sensor kinase
MALGVKIFDTGQEDLVLPCECLHARIGNLYVHAAVSGGGGQGAHEVIMRPVVSRPDRWLGWLIVASLVLPPAFFGLVAYQSRTATVASAEQRMAGTVRLLREQAEKVLDTNQLVIQQVDRLTAGMSWDEIAQSQTLHQQLDDLDNELAQVQSIYLAAPDGFVVNSSNSFPTRPISASDRPYFSAFRDGYQGTFISKVYRGRATGVEQFAIARRRSSPDGSFNGVIVAADSPDYFEKAYQGIGDEKASIVLARDDGEELASYPAAMFADSHAPANLIAQFPQDKPLLVNAVPHPYDKTDRVGVYQRIEGYPLFVGYSLPRAAITANWRNTVILNGILVGIGSLTVALVGWLALRGYRSERTEAQRREEAEAKMIEAMSMEAIGHLTAGVAHDFGNLLTVISGNIERLHAERGGHDDKIEAALSATARGDALIRKMLTFAHRHERDPELVDINEALTSCRPLLGSALRRDIVVEYHLSSQAVICRIDRAEFDFAILNIATNAGHAMPNGGRLAIEIGTVLIGAVGNELDLAPGEYAKIAIMDTGQGMPPDVLARAFELFFTTRESSTGTGLGLSQVYGFAKQSGGLATIGSAVGRGTTVTVYLPIADYLAIAEYAGAIRDDNGVMTSADEPATSQGSSIIIGQCQPP